MDYGLFSFSGQIFIRHLTSKQMENYQLTDFSDVLVHGQVQTLVEDNAPVFFVKKEDGFLLEVFRLQFIVVYPGLDFHGTFSIEWMPRFLDAGS